MFHARKKRKLCPLHVSHPGDGERQLKRKGVRTRRIRREFMQRERELLISVANHKGSAADEAAP